MQRMEKKQKAYVIVTDGKNILVGTGGKSGKKKSKRKGFHLPGGTVDEDEDSRETVERELLEEMGIEMKSIKKEEKIEECSTNNAKFFIVKCTNLDELAKNFKRPDVTNEYDEPFEGVEVKTIDGSIFNQEDWTDWFGEGVEQAKKEKLL